MHEEIDKTGRAAADSAHLTQAGSGRDQFGGGMHFFGIDWVGVNAENGRKLLLSVMFIGVVVLSSVILRALVGLVLGRTDHATVQTRFWTRQGVSLVAAFVLILGLLSIWFNDPTRLATAFGLMSAGLAFALQQVVTAIAGYFVILRGSTFTIGDRISDGRGARRRAAIGLYSNDHHGNGPAAQRAGRRSGDVGEEPSVHRPHCHSQQLQNLR